MPPLAAAGLDRDAQGVAGPEHLALVGVALAAEQFQRRRRDDAGRDAVRLQLLAHRERQGEFGAGADQHGLGRAACRLGADVGAAGHGAGGGRRQHRQLLSGEHERGGAVAALERHPPCLGGLVGVAGAQRDHVGDHAQRDHVLDRLVRRAVLAEADRVVGEHVGHRQLHQRRQPHRRPQVVGEDEERRDERPHPAVQRDAVRGRGHRVLADAEVEVAALVGPRSDGGLAGEQRVGRGGEVARAAEQLREPRREGVERLARGLAGRELRPRGERRQRLVPAGRQLAGEAALEFGGLPGIGVPVALEQLHPGVVRRRAPLPVLAEALPDLLGDDERLRGRPPQRGAGRRGRLGPERLAVRLAAVLLGAGPADVGADADQRGRVLGGGGLLERRRDRGEVVAVVDVERAPPVGGEARLHVLGEGQVGGPFDGDVVVVVQHREAAEPEVAGERRRLVRDPFHHVAVARDHPGPVVDDRHAVAVEARREVALGERHAHGGGEALPERAGRALDAGGEPVFRVTGCLRPPLAEALQLLERQAVAEKVEQRVQHRGRVAGGEHEAVAVRPRRVGGVVAEEAAPQHVRHRGRPQGHAGVSGARLLHFVHRKHPHRGDCTLVHLVERPHGPSRGAAIVAHRGGWGNLGRMVECAAPDEAPATQRKRRRT